MTRVKILKINTRLNLAKKGARMSFKIQQGDLVWAKVKGYPWWPGMVNIFSKRACNCSKSSFKAVFSYLECSTQFLEVFNLCG